MKDYGIYIDHQDEKQVAWWNNVASKLVRVTHHHNVNDVMTGEQIGTIFVIKGLLCRYVRWKNRKKFIRNPINATLTIK